jgi:hypothetical protein
MVLSVTEIDSILAAAIELPSPEERAEYVQRICGENAELRKRVDELQAASLSLGSWPVRRVSRKVD